MLHQKFHISAQYLKTTPIAVTILDVHGPAHFVVRESPTLDASTEAKHFVEAEGAMQKYYQSIEPGFFQLPLKDSIVVVLFKDKFYRAKVIRILNLSAGHLFKVYLVDYGIECSVERNCIYEIEKDFLVHPFQAVDFKLLGLEPISLVMDDILNFSYGPVSSWDPSADTFVADIRKKVCSAYIEVQAVDKEHIFGKLFLCLNDNLTRCLNEEFLSNKFARYNEDLAKKVQNIEKYLETGDVDVIELPSTVEPISNTELNPEQMSSKSEIEPDFFGCKMMFVRPSDGKIVSQSCIAENTVEEEDDLFDQLMSEKVSDSNCQQKTSSPPKIPGKTSPAKVSTESISPSSVSENPTEAQNTMAQKRLLKLRKSYENKLKSSKPVENGICSTSANISSAVENTEINATNVCSNDAQHLSTNESPVTSDDKSNTISPAKLNNTFNSDSSELCDAGRKSSVEAQEKTTVTSPRQNETRESLIIHKRFLKLQQRCRKKSEPSSPYKDADPSNVQNPSCSPSKEEMKSSSDGTPIKDNFEIMHESNDLTKPIEKPGSPISTSKTSKEEVNKSPISTSKTSEEEVNKSPTLESSENNCSTDRQNGNPEQLIMHKRFLKLQKMCRKKCEPSSPPKDTDSSHIQNPPYSPSKEEIKSSRDEMQIKDDLNKMQELNDKYKAPNGFAKPVKNPEPPISSINNTSREKVNKSPTLASFENNYTSDNSSSSHQRRVTRNHTSNTSDSEDPFNIIYKENNSLDSVDLVESFIELSTQLQRSQNKYFVFNDKNSCGNQNIAELKIKTGISSPIHTLEETNFSEYLLEVLKDLKFTGPSGLQSVVWPAMAKKQSIIMVSPPHSGKTIAYILPLISYLTSKSCCLPKKKGPFIIILCSSWVKAANVNDLLQLFLAGLKIKISSLCTHGGMYRNKVEPIVNNCDILIATPFCLHEFLKNKFISLDRCEHFILDDGTALMNKDKKELKSIFVFLTDSVRESQKHPQIVLCARQWNKNFDIIKDKLMFSPAIFFTSALESTVYAKVPIFAHVCKATEKKAVLLNTLPKSGKIVVCTRDSLVAQAVHHFLRWEDVRCFLVHEDMEQYIVDEVIKDWKSAKCMTSAHCLIVTDSILMKISISAVDCLVHYDIPPDSRLQFENRFSCIFEHFNKPDGDPECMCHIYIQESEYRFAPQLIEIIENTCGTPSKELIHVAKNRDQDENLSGSLCHYLKAFGFCENLHCSNRHSVNPDSDKPQMVPYEGDIQALVTYIIDPSHYYVRLLKYLDPISNKTISLATTYAQIGFQLKDFYKDASEKFVVKSPVVGKSYVLVEENNLFYRIKVLDVRTAPVSQLPVWKILYLDEGWVKFCNQPKLFKISDEINLPEPLAVEVYVCKISPPDSCFNWNPQTTNLVKDLIGGKEICGKIALCMGKILWLDPIVLRVELANASEYVNLFKLNQRLLECGHVRLNKNHLHLLKKMCRDKIPLPQVTKAIIPKVESPKVETSINYAFLDCESYEDVYVSSVVSPHHFYVQRAKFVDCLDNLLDDINERVENRKLKKAFTLQKGMPCIAPFPEDDRYYRAIITDISSCSEVQTFYVDFGDSGKVSRNNIYLLPSEFLLLPFQAIECELAGVTASHGGWTDSAADTLVTLTRDEAGDMKILKLKAYSKTKCYEGGNHYLVDLWFNEKNVSEQLLQMGLGIPSNIPVVTSAEELNDNFDLSSLKTGDSYDKNCTSSDEDLDSDDKDMKAAFFSAVQNMIVKQYHLGPQSKATITEVSSDEEEILKTIKKPFLPTSEASEKLKKLLPKFKSIPEDVSSAEGLKGLKPLIIWWDTTEELNVQINLKDIKLYQLDITDDGLYFNSVIANNQYTTTEKFYAEICSSGARTYQSREGINMVARKKSPFKWPRLTEEKTKFLHIKYDLIHIQDSDAEEQDPLTKSNFPMPPYIAEENYSSTDEDEKYVPPWNEIGQSSSHYDLMS